MKTNFIKLIILFVVGTQMIAGCGFHLRGQGDSLTATKLSGVEVYLAVTSEDNLLRRQIANDLQATGLKVVSKPEQSSNHLIILNSQVLRRAIGVDSNGRNNEFELNQNVEFLVNYVEVNRVEMNRVEENNIDLPAIRLTSRVSNTKLVEGLLRVQARRSFYLDNIDLIGKREEEKGLLDSIRQEVSRKIISRFVVSLDRQLKQNSNS